MRLPWWLNPWREVRWHRRWLKRLTEDVTEARDKMWQAFAATKAAEEQARQARAMLKHVNAIRQSHKAELRRVRAVLVANIGCDPLVRSIDAYLEKPHETVAGDLGALIQMVRHVVSDP